MWVQNVGLLPGTSVVFASDAAAIDRYMAAALKPLYGDRIAVCDGTADNVEIQAAIDALTAGRTTVERVKLIGSFTIAVVVTIPSYTRLDSTEAKLTLANGVTQNILTNSDIVGGNTHIYIDGGILDGNAANVTGARPIYLNNVTRSRVENCFITAGKTGGLYVTDSDNILIQGNVLDANLQIGIEAATSTNVSINDNIVINQAQGSTLGSSIYIYNCNNSKVVNNTISDSAMTVDGGFGISIYYGNSDILVQGNTLCNIGWNGISVQGVGGHENTRVTVSGNNLRNIDGTYGILVSASVGSIVMGNELYDCANYGIGLLTSDHSDVSHNTVDTVTASPGMLIKGNYQKIAFNTIKGVAATISVRVDTATYCEIIGNILDTAATWGFYEAGGSNKNNYYNNEIVNITTPFAGLGADCVVRNNKGYIAPGELRTASGSLTKTDYTFTTVTGTFTETGTQLKPGANTVHCTADGTAKIDIPTGCVAIAASVGGGATVADSPKTLVNNTAFAVTAGGTNEFTITITHIAFAWHDVELQDIFIKKVVVNITTKGGTATATMDVGIADDATGTNLGAEFFNDIDVDAAAAVHDSYVAGGGGAQTLWVLCQDSASAPDGWIVGKIITEIADGLVGSYYIEYVGK
jgi:parallel beta-helix repeat protein